MQTRDGDRRHAQSTFRACQGPGPLHHVGCGDANEQVRRSVTNAAALRPPEDHAATRNADAGRTRAGNDTRAAAVQHEIERSQAANEGGRQRQQPQSSGARRNGHPSARCTCSSLDAGSHPSSNQGPFEPCNHAGSGEPVKEGRSLAPSRRLSVHRSATRATQAHIREQPCETSAHAQTGGGHQPHPPTPSRPRRCGRARRTSRTWKRCEAPNWCL